MFFRSREVEVSPMNGAGLRKCANSSVLRKKKRLSIWILVGLRSKTGNMASHGAMDFACQECARRWKQRPDFGPVLLVYTEGLIWPPYDQADCFPTLYCEPCPDNEAAIQRA